MPFDVLLTTAAGQDLRDLYHYVARHDAPERADHVLSAIERALGGLCELPERGSHPPELAALGIRTYREVFFKPYRIVYRIQGEQVYVLVIADGRRDLRTLLRRRLLDA